MSIETTTGTPSVPFKILSLHPVGIRRKVYPIETCTYCRGLLNELCAECVEKNSQNVVLDCEVHTDNDKYFHKHCFTSIEKSSTTTIKN